MPIKNTATTIAIIAWNTNTQLGQTGDSANITVRGIGDGSEFTPSAPTITEKDATYLKGVYSVSLIASENNHDQVTIGGISSSSNVVIIPFSWANEQADFNSTQKASLNTEVDTALSDINLDHLMKVAKDTNWATTITKESVIDLMTSKDTSQTYDRATDSLEGNADNVIEVHTHVGTIDGHITADYSATEKSAIDLLDDTSGGLADIHTDVGTAITAIGTVDDYVDSEVGAITTELAKVPKSDGAVTFNSTALASINAEVDTALNTAIPGTNTANSVNDVLLDQVSAKLPTNNMIGSSDKDNHDTDIDSILADTNELQGLISSSKLPAQVKGMDANVMTASALATDAVTEITDAVIAAGTGAGRLVNEGETLLGNVFLKNSVQVDKYLGLYTDATEPIETATLATITEPSVTNGYARIKLENADWTESLTIVGQFTQVEKHFSASGGNIGPVTGYFICTTSSGTTGKLITVEHFNDPVTILDGGDPLYITPTQTVA